MTIEQANLIAAAVKLPPGWSLVVTAERRFALREEFGIRVYRHGQFVRGNSGVYGRRMVVSELAAHARRIWDETPMTVTTDSKGYVTSMDPTDA